MEQAPEIVNADDIQAKFDALALQAAQETDVQKTFSFGELFAVKDDEQVFLIPDLIPAGTVAMFIGEDGIGKTQLMTQLCLQIATAQKTFLNLPLIYKHGAAIIAATEDSRQKWIRAAAKQFRYLNPDFDPNKVRLRFTEGADFDNLQGLILELEKQLKAEPADLAVIDAMSDLFTMIDGEINSNAHARKILGIIQMLANRHECAIIIIHHAAKTKIVQKRKDGKLFNTKDDSQGAGAITQKPRTVLSLTHDPKTVINNGLSYKNFFHAVKANLMSKFYVTKAIELDFDAVSLVHNPVGLVDIEQYESGNTEDAKQTPTAAPEDVRTMREIHEQHLTGVFESAELLLTSDLIEKLMQYYGVGRNKVESKTGIKNELIEMQLIEKEGKYWKRVKPAPAGFQQSLDLPQNYFSDNFNPDEVPPDSDTPEEPAPF